MTFNIHVTEPAVMLSLYELSLTRPVKGECTVVGFM